MSLIALWSQIREQRSVMGLSVEVGFSPGLLAVRPAYWLHLLVRWSMEINRLCNRPSDPNIATLSQVPGAIDRVGGVHVNLYVGRILSRILLFQVKRASDSNNCTHSVLCSYVKKSFNRHIIRRRIEWTWIWENHISISIVICVCLSSSDITC